MAARKKKVVKKARGVGSWIEPRVAKLLDLFLRVAKDVGKPYAIGGALAMGAHGFERQTKDVDAFIEYEGRGQWIRALRERGLTVEPLFHGVHYAAFLPEHRDPAVRIDLMIPAEDPDLSAIEAPDSGTVAGRAAEIWPVALIVVAKFQSGREKDPGDIDEMHERGMFDPREVCTIMGHMHEPGKARSFWAKYGDGRR